jgi:hypothetical protein
MAEQRSRRSTAEQEPEEPDEPQGPRQGVCPVAFCPVGLAMTMADQVRPEVAEHLLAAGRELLLAVKAVVDARAEGFARESPLEKITIE